VGVRVRGAKEAADFLRGLNHLMAQNLAVATRENGMRIRDATVRKITEGDPSWPANSPLTVARKGSSKPLIDHGDLRTSVHILAASAGRLFVGIPRAAKESGGMSLFRLGLVHEFGAKINPRKAKMLVIPVSREADQLVRQYGRIGNIPGLFRPRGAGGQLRNVLCVRDGKNGGLKVLFILKMKVVIPPRPFIRPVINQERPKCRMRWEAAARAALQGKAYRGQFA